MKDGRIYDASEPYGTIFFDTYEEAEKMRDAFLHLWWRDIELVLRSGPKGVFKLFGYDPERCKATKDIYEYLGMTDEEKKWCEEKEAAREAKIKADEEKKLKKRGNSK